MIDAIWYEKFNPWNGRNDGYCDLSIIGKDIEHNDQIEEQFIAIVMGLTE